MRKQFYKIFSQSSRNAGFVILNFTPDNIGRLEPLMLAMFCVYQNLQVILPRINVSEARG